MLVLWLTVLLSSAVSSSVPQQQLNGHSHSDSFPSLNFSSPFPLIFHSVFGLMQQWPNTFFPNGHTIAPCTIAKNTNLYHARIGAAFPPSPEWFAFDSEMSYAIAGLARDSHLLTFRTTKEVRCLYFDGTSASLEDDGSMDSQMLLIHNDSAHVPDYPEWPPVWNGSNRPPCRSYGDTNRTNWNPLQAEYGRATGLCDLIRDQNLGGLGWGYEGIVRMNAAFELIWCNFSSPSAKLVSRLKVSVPLLDGMSDGYSLSVHRSALQSEDLAAMSGSPSSGIGYRFPDFSHPFLNNSIYEWFHAASKRYGFAGSMPGGGEARVTIDSAALSTFYDPVLANQEHARLGQESVAYNLSEEGYWNSPLTAVDRQAGLLKLSRRRRTQRVLNVSHSDGLYMRAVVLHRLHDSLGTNASRISGTNWALVVQEIVLYYSNALRALRTHLNASARYVEGGNLRSSVALVREVSHYLWMPYHEYHRPVEGLLDSAFGLSASESRAALDRCKAQHEVDDPEDLTDSEQLTYKAVSDTLVAICGTLLPIMLSTERIWLLNFNNVSAAPPAADTPTYHNIQAIIRRNMYALEELMAWLGWVDQWTACSPGCELGQVCYIPTWPAMGLFSVFSRRRNDTESGIYTDRSARPHFGMDAPEEYLWEPRCVDAEHFPSGAPDL